MAKLVSAIVALSCAFGAHAAELGTYPTLNLAKVAGVDGSNNVGLAVVSALPCSAPSPNNTSPAIFFNPLTNALNCSAQIGIDNTVLSIGALGALAFPDGSRWTNAGLSAFGATFNALTVSTTGGLPASLFCFTQASTGSCQTQFGFAINGNFNSVFLQFNLAGNGSQSNSLCLNWLGTNQCRQTWSANGSEVISGTITTGANGDVNHTALVFSSCGTTCGFWTNAANQLGLGINGGTVWNATTTALTMSKPLGLSGYTVSTLPGSPSVGWTAYVTDATVCTYGGALTGGSTTYCKVQYNGSAWVGG